MIDSVTLAPETPTQASQSDNVRKCPVLSGPTDPTDQTDLSSYNHKTCEQSPSSPDQTSPRHHPAQPIPPEPQAAQILFEVPREGD